MKLCEYFSLLIPCGEWLVTDIHFAGLPRVTGLCIRYERAVLGYACSSWDSDGSGTILAFGLPSV